MTAGARRLHPGDAFGLFRRSLGLRMVALTLSIGIVLIVLLTLVVSNLIRDDVFEDRSAAILSDAHQRVAAAQAELDNADTTTADSRSWGSPSTPSPARGAGATTASTSSRCTSPTAGRRA